MKFWKVQKFFGDVVYDLRQRGLLPVAIGLLVAMVAIPLVISQSGGGSTAPPPTSGADVAQASEVAPENQKAVVAYNPGLRKYKDRLKDLAAKDPFTQQFSQSAETAATSLDSAGGGSAPSASDIPSTGGGGGTGTTDTGGSTDTTGGGGSGKSTVRYFWTEADVLAGESTAPLQKFKGLFGFTPLPSQFTPVAIFAGATLDGKQAYFILSSEVSQVSGEGVCLPSTTDCSLLALEVGQTETLLYDVDGKIYTIKVTKLKRVTGKNPPKK